MRPTFALALLALCLSFAADPLAAQGFSFSRDAAQTEAQQQADDAAKQQRISELLSTPCRNDLKGKKIAVVIGEVQSNGWIVAHQENYGRHFQAINSATTTSSNDAANANTAPDRTPGRISGNVTRRNVASGGAPSEDAARSSVRSKPDKVARTVTTTNGTPSVACARINPA